MGKLSTFQLILSAVFVLLAVVGFIMFATYKGFGAGGKDAAGTVVIWGTLPLEQMDTTLAALATAKPEYKNVSYEAHDASSFSFDLANAIATNKGPDLILISQEFLLSERDKLSVIPFSSIPQRTFLNSYVPAAGVLLTDQGVYGIPFLFDPLVLYFNQDILSSVGFGNPPSSWEAVTALAERITTRRDDQSLIRSTVALGEYDNVTNARALISLLLLQAGLPLTQITQQGLKANLTEGGVTSVSGVDLGEAAINFYTQFANPNKTVYSWNRSEPYSREAFLAGDLALYFGFASERTFLKDANPNLNFDMAPAPQPASANKRVSFGELYFFGIPMTAKNSAGAFKTALALTDSEFVSVAAHQLSMAPAPRAALVPSPEDLYAPVFYPEALTGAVWLSPPPFQTDRIFSTMISNIISGRKETQPALNAAEQALNELLR